MLKLEVLGGKMLRNITCILGGGPGERLVTRGKHSKAPATRALKETKNSSFELAGIRVTGIDSIFNSPLE